MHTDVEAKGLADMLIEDAHVRSCPDAIAHGLYVGRTHDGDGKCRRNGLMVFRSSAGIPCRSYRVPD